MMLTIRTLVYSMQDEHGRNVGDLVESITYEANVFTAPDGEVVHEDDLEAFAARRGVRLHGHYRVRRDWRREAIKAEAAYLDRLIEASAQAVAERLKLRKEMGQALRPRKERPIRQYPATRWADEKLRRSNVDWYALIPYNVATAQIAYEKRMTVKSMLDGGMTCGQIAEAFGVSRGRAYQMVVDSRSPWRSNKPAPVEVYQSREYLHSFDADEAGCLLSLIEPFTLPARAAVARDWIYV